jgi:hypothetical protein
VSWSGRYQCQFLAGHAGPLSVVQLTSFHGKLTVIGPH